MGYSPECFDPRRVKFDAFMKSRIPYIQRPDGTLAGYLVKKELNGFSKVDQGYMHDLPQCCIEIEDTESDNRHRRLIEDPEGISVKGVTIDELEGRGEIIKLTPKAYSEYYFNPKLDELYVALSKNG